MTTKVLAIDPKKCTDCGFCEIACSLVHARVCNPERSRIRVIDFSDDRIFLPLTCQQCEDAPCARVCPRQAISRDEARVRTTIDYGLCVGCRMCAFACPFGAMGFDAQMGRPFKCDLCGGDPVCVTFCAPGALAYVDANRHQYRRIRDSALKTAGVRR